MTEYFDLEPEVPYWFTGSGSNDGRFSLNGGILSWISNTVTSAGQDFRVTQGITWDRWPSQNSVAVGQQTLSSNASLKVVQERVSQPNFNGTVTLPELVRAGDTIQPVVENFTELDYAEVHWQWQRNLLGVWEDIQGATELTYTVTASDEQASLRLRYNAGMSANAYYMYTNEAKCGDVWTYAVGMIADRTTIEKDEQIALSVAVRRNDGAPADGTVQLYLDGAAYGEPVAVTAGMTQFTLRGQDMSVGKRKVYATFQSEYGGTLKSNEVTVTVNKADLSDLLITNVPTDRSEYYSGTTAGTRNSITVTYDKEKWPQGLDFSKCVNITVYYNGKEDADQKSRLVTVSSDGAVYSICRLASYALKVDINSDSYCGAITTGTLTITQSPVTIKPKDLYFAPGERALLEPDILNDGVTSFGLRGSDYWQSWTKFEVKNAEGTVVASQTSPMLGAETDLPAGEYEMSIVPNDLLGPLILCYDEYKTEKELLLGMYDITLLPGKLVITDEPVVNLTSIFRSGNYLDIDMDDWTTEGNLYAGYNLDQVNLPEGFSMDQLEFTVTYNGLDVTDRLYPKFGNNNRYRTFGVLETDDDTVRLYPNRCGTYTITAKLKPGVTDYQLNASTVVASVGKAPAAIGMYLEKPNKIYYPGDELVVYIDHVGEIRDSDAFMYFWTDDSAVDFTINGQTIKGQYTDGPTRVPLRCVLTVPEDFQPGNYAIGLDPMYFNMVVPRKMEYGYEPVSFRVANPEYMVTIPASVEMDETGKASLPLSCNQLESCNRLTVTVDSANGLKMQGGGGTIAYTLTAQNGMVIFDGNTAATLTGTGTTTLGLAVAEGQTLTPGSYTDTLTFIASVE